MKGVVRERGAPGCTTEGGGISQCHWSQPKRPKEVVFQPGAELSRGKSSLQVTGSEISKEEAHSAGP